MKAELQNKLYNKYPHFFEYLKDHKDGIILPMQFGVECKNGWYFLLDRLMGNITSYMKQQNETKVIKNKLLRYIFRWEFFIFKWLSYFKVGRKIVSMLLRFSWRFKETNPEPIVVDIMQIKEKFGSLRFYINGGDKYINNIISYTEYLSRYICEECGTTENVGRTDGWYMTLCDKCIKGNNLEHTWKKIDN